ncbi:MAG: alpha/beta fold hydrolase [Desulfobacteraceae bacterium]|nr:MAG: alpha/beta fold hydrolase [Desulfobacteraceae bacterium]
MTEEKFNPAFFLNNAHIQTYLASSRLRTTGKNPMLDKAEEIIIRTKEGVRLLASYSPYGEHKSKGVVMLLHGWEGSAASAYILSAGRYLFENGYSVFRLNYRDHGNSHHLNEGLFYATLIDEVFQAVQQASAIEGGLNFFLAGFSLGGNYALRIGRICAKEPIKNLRHIVSISPAIDPDKATGAIDKNILIKKYFLAKWRRSLALKQKLYPGRYDFGDIISLNSCRSITERLIQSYSSYNSAAEYFRGYAITGDTIREITVPTTIITSKDDPVIPVCDFYAIDFREPAKLMIHGRGGHNGFIEDIFFNCWYEKMMVRLFDGMKPLHDT